MPWCWVHRAGSTEDVMIDACRADGVPILRRSSGGGTVVVGPGTLNVTVILPESAAPGLATVDVAHRYVLDWIARSHPAARARGHASPAWATWCSATASAAAVPSGGSRHWFMVHCSILYDFSIERIVRYLAIPRRQPEYRQGRGHHEFLRNLGLPRKILDGRDRRETRRPGACPARRALCDRSFPDGREIRQPSLDRAILSQFGNVHRLISAQGFALARLREV